MKILWLSEMGFFGQVPLDNPNLKSDVALIACSGATHLPYNYPLKLEDYEQFDFIMVNCTRKFFTEPNFIHYLPIIKKNFNIKVGFFQEGPIYDWQDWSQKEQSLWIKSMKLIDIYFCSNQMDIPYYESYVKYNVPVKWLKSPIHLERIKSLIPSDIKKEGVVVGGTNCIWYNGQTSLKIADILKEKIYIPRMGRMKEDEQLYNNINIRSKVVTLPYLTFDEWLYNLNKCKFGVHMMAQVAAGSFHTNCAALGIPCVGNAEIDPQRLLFPDLSIHLYRDIKKGRELLVKLHFEKSFYEEVVSKALNNVKAWDIKVVEKELKEMIGEVI